MLALQIISKQKHGKQSSLRIVKLKTCVKENFSHHLEPLLTYATFSNASKNLM